jgi:hypothetical protein
LPGGTAAGGGVSETFDGVAPTLGMGTSAALLAVESSEPGSPKPEPAKAGRLVRINKAIMNNPMCRMVVPPQMPHLVSLRSGSRQTSYEPSRDLGRVWFTCH